jgi:hypothetical protein
LSPTTARGVAGTQPGDSWSRIFVKGGTYRYRGAVKTDQHGTVEVATARVI